MSLVADRKLDCVGLFCPMPILKTRDALKGMDVGQTLEMLSDVGVSELAVYERRQRRLEKIG